jgi:hypothetical protein
MPQKKHRPEEIVAKLRQVGLCRNNLFQSFS